MSTRETKIYHDWYVITTYSGSSQKRENEDKLLERPQRKKNRSVVIFVRIEKMTVFSKFFYLVLQ